MTKRGHLRDELRRLGNSPVPVLDPVRAQRLERRVLEMARPRELELVDAESVDAPRVSRRRAAIVTVAAACLLVVAVIASLDRTGSPDRILFTSGDVEVLLPDGSVLEGSARMNVPDGAILRLGRDGEAEVDGITISGAGDYLVTPDGLRLLTSPRPTAATSQPSVPADDPSTVAAPAPVVDTRTRPVEPVPATTGVRPTTTERDSATSVVRPTTTARESATTVAPPTTRRIAPPPPPPGDSLAPRPTATTSPTTSSTPATIPPPSGSEPTRAAPALLDVTVRSDERRVAFAWRPVAGATGYVLAVVPAVADGGAGSWPPAPGVEVTELPQGTLQHTVARRDDGAWSYRLAAVGGDGRTLALSRVFTIES